jgi:hypothetical protein
MAGETVLPIQECPDLICSYITKSWGTSDNTLEDRIMFYCERDTIVDSFHAGCNQADTGAAVVLTAAPVADDNTITFGSAVAISSSVSIATGDTLNAGTMTETANLVPAGYIIYIDATNLDDANADIHVQMRIRTRIR